MTLCFQGRFLLSHGNVSLYLLALGILWQWCLKFYSRSLKLIHILYWSYFYIQWDPRCFVFRNTRITLSMVITVTDMSTSQAVRLRKPYANGLALGLRHVAWCLTIPRVVYVCWRHSLVLWHENMLNTGWWYSATKRIWSVRCGYEIRQALSRIVL